MGDQIVKVPNRHLLKNRKVIEEINRHLWIESERAGYDIGFDKAAEDWLIRFSKAWMKYHLPKRNAKLHKKSTSSNLVARTKSPSRKKFQARKAS